MIVDSGFRRGADVIKALALGANAVMLGRALQIYRDEIDRVLGLIGCTSLDQLTREHVDMRYAQGHSATTGD